MLIEPIDYPYGPHVAFKISEIAAGEWSPLGAWCGGHLSNFEPKWLLDAWPSPCDFGFQNGIVADDGRGEGFAVFEDADLAEQFLADFTCAAPDDE